MSGGDVTYDVDCIRGCEKVDWNGAKGLHNQEYAIKQYTY